jgi:hypothetical protein
MPDHLSALVEMAQVRLRFPGTLEDVRLLGSGGKAGAGALGSPSPCGEGKKSVT